MQIQASKQELEQRLKNFYAAMQKADPKWDTAVIVGKVNQYYFTGTMQDGMLVFKKDGNVYYFVRRSFARAREESVFKNIYPMESYRDAAEVAGQDFGLTYIESETITVGMLERMKRKFTVQSVKSMDSVLLSIRAVKSPFELAWMEESGRRHHRFFHEDVPALLKEGVSEADFAASLFPKMVKAGFQGMSRFAMFQNELVLGQIAFGEGSLYPTSFDGPGGATGISPAAPFLGSRERKLKRGDLVFVDVGFAVNGYHTDKTQVYMFGAEPPKEAVEAHGACLEIENRIAAMMRPGAVPAEIYNSVMDSLSDSFKENFMGFKERSVKFLGHGVGLHVDEMPLIAPGYKIPLEAGMTLALEPKKWIPGVGMVGVEDTFVVEDGGGRCITGEGSAIIVV